MHTTKQALLLWCPMARVANASADGAVATNQTVFNRLQIDTNTGMPDASSCVGKYCAMWRWGEMHPMRKVIPAEAFNQAVHGRDNFEFFPADDAEGEPDRYIETEASADERRRGFCGLAGSCYSNY